MPNEIRSRTATKPLTPALSSNLRSRPAHALTPRLAGIAPTSPAQTSTRVFRQQTISPDGKEGERTLSLNSNITPRSGARRSRLETDSPSTPDTASRSRWTSTDSQAAVEIDSRFDLGISSPNVSPTHPSSRSTEQVSLLPTANGRRISGDSSVSAVKDDTKFFRADEIRPSNTPARVMRPRSAFITTPGLRIAPRKDSGDRRPRSVPKSPDSATRSYMSSAVRYVRSPTQTSSSSASTQSLPLQRAAPYATVPDQSPSLSSVNTYQGPELRPRKSSNASPIATSSSTTDRRRSTSINNIVSTKFPEHMLRRRSSTTSSQAQTKHSKSASTDHHLDPVITSITADLSASAATEALPMPSGLQSESMCTSRPALPARHTRGSSEATALQPVSKEQMEAAANARRERKVLDLEISNSSLLAINRTLEKELRKQNAELRRFRRLSQSGRLSLIPSNRIVSGASISTLATLDESDSAMTPPRASPTSSDIDSPEDDEHSDGGSSLTESSDMIRRRARDEKRMLQDLQRHQQILIDSQKLTQSIQRCLNCTDELIQDGNKALSYRVEASEVQLGGRVLQQDDDEALSEVDFAEYREGMPKPRQGLLSPISTKSGLEEATMWITGLKSLNERMPNEQTHTWPEEITADHELSPVILPQA